MYKGKKIGVVVPAYNEENLITKTLSTVPEFVDIVVVVDDGSTDKTADLIDQIKLNDKRIVTITNKQNLGLGASIWKGYAKCDEKGMDIFVVMAGDAQMDPEDLPALLDSIAEDRAEYSKGNRLQHIDIKENMPIWRFYGNAVLTILTKFATGYWHAVDPQCGYTAIKRVAYQKLNKENIHAGYGYNSDILLRLNLLNCRLAEVTVKAIYGEAASGIKLRKYIFRTSRLLLKQFFRRLRAKYLWSFHPILLYYIFGLILFLLGFLEGAFLLAMDITNLFGVGFGWMLIGVIMIITGFQLLLLAIRLDMEDNKKLNANKEIFDEFI